MGYAGEMANLGAECMVVEDFSRGWDRYCAKKPKLAAECMVVHDPHVGGKALRRMHWWRQDYRRMQNIIDTFKPDIVVCVPDAFGMAAQRLGAPTVFYLTINPWQKRASHLAMTCRTSLRRITHYRSARIFEQCMRHSQGILTISRDLEKIVRERHPDKPVYTVHSGIDPDPWYPEKGMSLNHPCVGLIQEASIWDKAKELLVLGRILARLPNVTFYWVGFGKFTDKILSRLREYPNFQYQGRLEHPVDIRKFLTEIDMFALLSGMDALPTVIQEAMLMSKPVVATNTGGVSELVEHGKNGFLVEQGDVGAIADHITRCLEDSKLAGRLGSYGRRSIKRNFTPEATARRILEVLESRASGS